jgi:phage tail-like protein
MWERDPPPPKLSVGTLLKVVEKLFSGIADGEHVLHGDHEHEPIEAVVDRLFRLFQPWATPPEFLEWLASWVALEFPGIWDEYQRRKVTGEIVQIYQRRGLKYGLDTYLDLYTIAAKRPRITVDDSNKVLFVRPASERFAPVHALVSQQPLIRPLCMALGPDEQLYVGDAGTTTTAPVTIDEGVWRLSLTGEYDFAGVPLPAPQRLGHAGWVLVTPRAVAVDAANPWNLFVLDAVGPGPTTSLWRLTSPGFKPAVARATKTQLKTVFPVAMAFDLNGHLLILDRGTGFGTATPPRILDVDVVPTPVVSTVRALTTVVEPLSLLVQPNGDLIIGDAKAQTVVGPADLVRVDRTNALNWVESSLLGAVSVGANPLLAPTAVVREDATHLFVLDLGLRQFAPPLVDLFLRAQVQSSAIYRVDLGAVPPVVTRACETRQMVFPLGMVLHDGTLYVCDPGEPVTPAWPRTWRDVPHEFGGMAHFVTPAVATPQELQERRQYVSSIGDILRREKPAHTLVTVVASV